MRTKSKFFACLCGLLLAVAASAIPAPAQTTEGSAAHSVTNPSDLKWIPGIKGCESAVVQGDPSVEGQPFVIRIRCADATVIPAHWHPTDENITVLSGTFLIGMGDKYDTSKLTAMPPGSFASMPKEMRHFASSRGESVVQVHGIGPFKVNWVNPADVPRRDVKPK